MANNISIDGALNVVGAETIAGGVTIGDAAADTVGFYGTTPVAQPAATAQSSSPSTVITTVSSTSLTTLDLTKINALIARVEELRVLSDATRTALVSLGIMKGSI